MEEIDDLKKRIDHLQYDEINPLKDDVNDLRVSLNSNDILVKQSVESIKKLSDTMDTFKDTLIDIAQSVKDSNRVTNQLANTVSELNDRITSVETSTKKRLDEIDDKAKIDWQLWIKNNAVGFIMGIGALIYAISQVTG